jgi:hypothetical protein
MGEAHGMARRDFLAGLMGVSLAASVKEGTMADMAGDEAILEALDLSRPELAGVKAAYEKGDIAGARAAFAKHLRTRKTPKWHFDLAAPPKDLSPGVKAEADRALEHTFDSVGIRHAFGPKIDWAYNPTTQPGSPDAPDHEWTWQLNRHSAWVALARAYNATGDPKYGRELAQQIADWIRDNPTPARADQAPFSRWRTIEAGIRMFSSWPEVYFRMARHPDVFPDYALLAMTDCMRRHADYLDVFPTSGNWLCMEANGEFHVGVLFPEFKDAARWRKNALERLRREIDAQVYPDGAQIELTPGYHNVSLSNFVGTLRLARLNDIPLPGGYQAGLEKMYALNMWAMSPDRDVPPFNDSWHVNVPGVLADGLKLFPQRKDWAWIASDGKEGAPPAQTSYLFPFAGWAVMRTGWDRDARFMMIDAGPFGYGHQHEDKLSFVLHAFGRRMVFDAGSYAYDASEMRRYVLSARGHNVIHVDGLEQHRGGFSRDRYVTKTPFPLTWKTTPEYDYLAASFGEREEEGWGRERLKNVVHMRRILFVKPDYWIVCDTLTPNDSAEHTCESTFHLDAPEAVIAEAAKSVTTRDVGGANLMILPLAMPGLEVRIVQGQEKPFVQGWIPKEHGRTGADPRPCVYYTRRGSGVVHFLYVFAPAPEGKPFPVTAVTAAQVRGRQLVADIAVREGKTHRFALMSNSDVKFTRGAGAAPFTVRAQSS